MNLDELAFVNRQLAGMLRDGMPLEGALRGTVKELRSEALRSELTALESDLAQGTPLGTAIDRRQFPAVYRRLVRAGAAAGDLPGALLAAADHFQESVRLRRRLQAVLVYPTCVLAVMLGVCLTLGLTQGSMNQALEGLGGGRKNSLPMIPALIPTLLSLGLGAWLAALLIPGLRRWVSWRLPAWRDSQLAQLAETLGVLVRHGCPLPEAVQLVRELEPDSPMAPELANWEKRMAAGATKISEVAGGGDRGSILPPLFRWLVAQAGDRLGDGFATAAAYYRDRARHRFDLLIHGALPVSLLLLGFLVVQQFAPILRSLTMLIDSLGSDGGGT